MGKKGRHLRFLPSLNTRFPWKPTLGADSRLRKQEKERQSVHLYCRGAHCASISLPLRSVGYRTATHTVKSTQAQHDRVAQFVNLEFAHGTYEFGYLGQFIFAGPACNNALTNCAALLCRTQRRFNRMCSSTLSVNCEKAEKDTLW